MQNVNRIAPTSQKPHSPELKLGVYLFPLKIIWKNGKQN